MNRGEMCIAKRRTHEEFCQEIKNLYDGQFIILGNFKRVNEPIKIQCTKCNEQREPYAKDLLKGSLRCRKCIILQNFNNFRKQVYNLVGDEYKIVGEYKSNSTPIEMFHEKCGKTCAPLPSNFLKGTRCSNCYAPQRKTTEQFKKELKEVRGDEYVVLGEYKNIHTPIDIKHRVCGKIFKPTPNNILHVKTGCSHCYGNILKTFEEFSRELEQKYGNEYTPVDTNYKGNHKRMRFKHSICGEIIWKTPNALINVGSGCANCYMSPPKSDEEFKQQIYELFGSDYIVLSNYIKNDIEVEIKHSICGYRWIDIPKNITQNIHNCPKCFGRVYDTERLKNRVYDLVGEEYLVIGKYNGSLTKTEFFHVTCGKSFKMTPNAFLNIGNRCTHCRISKGEKRVDDYLKKVEVNFVREYTFTNCRHIRPLPFDFAIIDDQGKLLALIEYDGEHHYREWRFSCQKTAEEKLKNTQRNDSIKDKYCEENSILLLRIPYWEFNNIERILEKWLQNELGIVLKNTV